MKKEDLLSLLVYGLMIALAVVIGLCIIRPLFETLSTTNNMALGILLVLGGIVFNALLLELGHVIGAKLGGYQILSINFFGLCFYKTSQKTKFKFASFDGLTSETKIIPKKENASPKLYSLLPVIFYALELLAMMVLFNVLQATMKGDQGSVTYQNQLIVCIMAIMFITIGGMMFIYNIFPAKLDSINDGYRLLLLSKKENVAAFNELMRIEGSIISNDPLNDLKTFDHINDLTANINIYCAYQKMVAHDYDGAMNLFNQILNHKSEVSVPIYNHAFMEALFIILLTKDNEEIKNYYDAHINPDLRRYVSNDLSLSSIRTYSLLSSKLEISEHETRYALSRVEKANKRTPNYYLSLEKALLNETINYIDQIRPEWHIKEKEIK